MANRKSAKKAAKSVKKAPLSAALRWQPTVSPAGELLLRRRAPEDESGTGENMHYTFSQSLIFLARRWRNLMNEELQAVGQSHARWGTLYWIKVFGERINQTQLADRMGVEQPTLGRVLHKLEADGLIRRRAARGDRRARVIVLTAASKPLMQKINRIQNDVRARLLKNIAPAELAACLAVFAKILDNMDERPSKGR